MRKVAILIVLAMAMTACDNVSEVDALVGLANNSPNEVGLIINSREVGDIVPPGASLQMVVPLQIPNGRTGDPTIPVDEKVYASVSIKDFVTGELTEPIRCQLGAKVVTSVFYEIRGRPPYEYSYVRCNWY